MQTGSTNNHISQIFFVFAAPMYWWDWLAAPILMVRYKGDCHVSSTNDWAGVSGKGNRIIPRWRPNKKRKGHLSPWSETNIHHLPPSQPPCFWLVTTFMSIYRTQSLEAFFSEASGHSWASLLRQVVFTSLPIQRHTFFYRKHHFCYRGINKLYRLLLYRY